MWRCGTIDLNIDWSVIKSLLTLDINWTAIASILTLIGLATVWYHFFRKEKVEQSKNYLDEIKSKYAKSLSLINATDNNNVNWHLAIECLKMAESLITHLTEQAHQNICVMEIYYTAFQLVNIIKDINDFRFFYGVQNYSTQDSTSLFEQSNPIQFLGETPTLRIDPNALRCLCAFIDKANRIFFELESNGSTYHKIFNEKYFQSSIKDNTNVSAFSKPSMAVILNYIEDFEKHSEERRKASHAEYSTEEFELVT